MKYLKIFSVFLIIPLTLFAQNDTNEENCFIGRWTWINSDYSGRGGSAITTPDKTGKTITLEITLNNEIIIYENNAINCSDHFKINNSESGIHANLTNNCVRGKAIIKGDTLKIYTYLGCPFVNPFYIRERSTEFHN